MREGSPEQPGAAAIAGPLDVRLAVDAGCGCPLRDRDREDVRQSLTRSGPGEPDTCQLAVPDGDASGYERTAIDESCRCAVFERHDCIADLESAADGTLRYSLVVPDREVLRAIVADLRETGATVSLERLRTSAGDADTGGSAGDGRADASDDVALTPKQREALALAIEEGYYEQPREATLADLAAALDVSRSAVSQRLTAVERKLVCDRARAVTAEPAAGD